MTITQLQKQFEGALNDFEDCLITKEEVLKHFGNVLVKWTQEILTHQQNCFMENPTIISKEKDRFGKIFLTAVGIDENDPKALPLSDHIKELKRELRLREVAYGKQVEEKPNDAKRLRYQYRLLRRQLWFLLKLEQFNIKSL